MPARKRYELDQIGEDLVVTVPNRHKRNLLANMRGEYRGEASFIAALLTLKGKMLPEIGFDDAKALALTLNDNVATFAVKNMQAADFDALYAQGKKVTGDLTKYAAAQGIEISAPLMRYSESGKKIAPSLAVEGSKEQHKAFDEQLKAGNVLTKSLTKMDRRYIDIVVLPGQDVLQTLQEIVDKPKGRIRPSDEGKGQSR